MSGWPRLLDTVYTGLERLYRSVILTSPPYGQMSSLFCHEHDVLSTGYYFLAALIFSRSYCL